MKALGILASLLVLLFVVPAFSVCASEEPMKAQDEMEMEMEDAEEGMEYYCPFKKSYTRFLLAEKQ